MFVLQINWPVLRAIRLLENGIPTHIGDNGRKSIMQRMIRSIFVLFLLGFFTVTSAQLPPKVIADKYRIQVRQLLEEKRYITLLNIMDEILVLQKEHSLTLPHEFHFQYAQVTFSTGLFQTAVDAVKKYLAAAGKKGTFYKEALAFLFSS